MTLICSGSLAFDRLMAYPGVFAESFIAEKMSQVSLSFLVDRVSRAYGGTVGNIAYNLGLLGEKPLVVASLGDDPDGADYLERFRSWGFPPEGLKVQPGQLTASCTVATDRANSQFTFFHPGAMLAPTGFDPASLGPPYDRHLAIISAGGPAEMLSLAEAYGRLGLPFILDAGQQIHAFSRDELLALSEGAAVFISNAYEFELFKKITGLDLDGLFQRVQTVIVTRGAEGSELMVPGRGSQHISPVPVRQAVNPTGAGDAYRAGFMTALARGEALVSACRLGSTVASFCVEVEGTQEQTFTIGEVLARHQAFYRETFILGA
ncbi:MAG: carbohydrate kinase family protein [Candidatus Adiutrix sp.]|jgi:adenosine kinase|nr:carbohydrate kinase family protein [Candidatus Adiutrix sp.]